MLVCLTTEESLEVLDPEMRQTDGWEVATIVMGGVVDDISISGSPLTRLYVICQHCCGHHK